MKLQKRKMTFVGVLVVASVGVGLGAMKISSHELSATAAPAVVATVDGRPISATIYRMYLKNGIEALGLDDKTADGRRSIEQLKEGIVSELIDRFLIEAEVNRLRLPVSNEALTQSHQKTVAQMGGDTAYRAYLSEHGMADEEFRRTTALEVYSQLLRAELDKEVSVADSDIEKFYSKEHNNPQLADMFTEPERVRASHILFAARRSQIAREIQSEGAPGQAELERRVSTEMAKRQSRAASILERLKRGASFQRLAAEYSDDPGTRDRGGDLGLFARNTHTVRFDEAAFALKAGELSGIVETDYGYHIIRVTEHSPERALTLDEARKAIRERLLVAGQAAHLKAWLEDRRRQADIRIDPFYRTVGGNR
jgi:parvulin-like peptidyl-prolyl isomerase